ncbi:hypothetical protein FHS68_003766 [Dyadobacter arcticus]|uniref:Uncharacterized protein n=1 Tax=Dyadobacter arcticus TaxID=1078754 RepID=A0ABX0UR24_9BACT|nr:hypothetical protein [Dyadobacter arcticus]
MDFYVSELPEKQLHQVKVGFLQHVVKPPVDEQKY